MLYRRSGFPEVDEILLCKVTKIFPSSVFVELIEYPGRGAIVHISEVSPGRIRNLRDFVSIGRQIVCKVLRVDKEQGHIDLSLRRVNSVQRREKVDEIKQELKAESLVKNIAKKISKPVDKVYRELSTSIFKEYSHLYICFWDVASGEADLKKIGVPENLAKEFTEAVVEKFKPTKITIEGEITLKTYHADGVDKIRKTLIKVEEVSSTLSLSYLGAGRYKLIIEDVDYKPAEKNLTAVEKILQKFNDKKSTATFSRNKSD